MAHIRGIALAIAVLALSSTTVQADGDHNAPDFGSDSMTMSVPENSPSNTVVGRVSAGHNLNVMGEDESSDNSEADESSQQGRSEESSDDSGVGGDTPQEESEESSDDSGAGGDTPAKPTGLTATASHDSVTLTWDDPQDDSITGYVILRRNRDTDPKGEFTTLVEDTDTAATTYTDDSVAAETPYTYRIKAINDQGVSERSRWFHIDTPAAPEPEPDPALLAPANLIAATAVGQVFLSWDAPLEDAGSVTGYEILRGQGEDDPTTLVADTGIATATYTDETATQASTVYAYRVKAIRDGELSQASNEARVHLPPAGSAAGAECRVLRQRAALLGRPGRRHHNRLPDQARRHRRSGAGRVRRPQPGHRQHGHHPHRRHGGA